VYGFKALQDGGCVGVEVVSIEYLRFEAGAAGLADVLGLAGVEDELEVELGRELGESQFEIGRGRVQEDHQKGGQLSVLVRVDGGREPLYLLLHQ
jgi:hypothetical protein